jgi:putative component of membrane protein insertase Oxa1/YidC/SpoIIIJ protein YidD
MMHRQSNSVRWRSPLAWLALQSIALYQRHLSPRKGYCCALHAAGGVRSCSAYGYRAIARGGVMKGLALLRSRLDACGQVPRRRSALDRQRGFCDSGCDVGGCDTVGCDACDVADLCDGGCDWPSRKDKKSRQQVDLENEIALRERVRRNSQRRD